MKHDLEAINAALKLGDSFIPPKDSLIKLGGGKRIWSVVVVEFLGDDWWVKVKAPEDLDLSGLHIRYKTQTWRLRYKTQTWRLACMAEVVSVLPSSLPFSEWPRAKK